MLTPNSRGNYHFLRGGAAFSGAVLADEGYAITHVTLLNPLPVAEGFDFIAAYLEKQNRPAQAVCAIELRSPRQLSFADFGAFNNGTYLPALNKHDLLMEGAGPMTRSNLAVEIDPPPTQVIYAFGYTAPASEKTAARDFVLSGAADIKGSDIVRAGETSDDAMREKALYVMSELQERLDAMQLKWDDCTAFNVYTVYNIFPFLREVLLEKIGRAQWQGARWYFTRAPIAGLELEVDARRTLREVYLP